MVLCHSVIGEQTPHYGSHAGTGTGGGFWSGITVPHFCLPCI